MGTHNCCPTKDATVVKSTNKVLLLRFDEKQFKAKPAYIQIFSMGFDGHSFKEILLAEKEIKTEINYFTEQIEIDVNKETEALKMFKAYLDDIIQKAQLEYDIWFTGWYYKDEDANKKLQKDYKQNGCYYKQKIRFTFETEINSKPKESP